MIYFSEHYSCVIRNVTKFAIIAIAGSFGLIARSDVNATPPAALSVPGRIAISADGNEHDCDDITATAMSIALLAKSGNASKLVYLGHSDHIWSTGTDGACNGGNREEAMRVSSEETARMWGGFNAGVFINARANTSAAVSALAHQINLSSASDPLWIIGAGPMEVIGRALAASDPSRRQYVTVVSHSEWNDYHAEEPGHGTWNFYELGSVLGAKLKHIIDQNHTTQLHESYYAWLRDSSDSRLNWLWQRHIASGLSPTFDPSDAGMIYWLITGGINGGDETVTPEKFRAVLEGGAEKPAQTNFSFVLVTAPAGVSLGSVVDRGTINLSALPTRSLSINIVPSSPIGSLRIQFNGQVQIENVAPYALAGDLNSVYTPANLTVGSHTLTVTPYSGPNQSGSAGNSTTITFSVGEDSTEPPILLTETNTDLAIALGAGFEVAVSDKLSVGLFVGRLNLLPGEDSSALTVLAEDSSMKAYQLPVEFAGKVPGFDGITQLNVRLPDELANASDVFVRVTWRGLTSNKARLKMK